MPPDILDYPTSTDMVVREGSNVTLKCAATGSPTPNITWKRESGEKIMLHSGNEGDCLAKILITNSTRGMSGKILSKNIYFQMFASANSFMNFFMR